MGTTRKNPPPSVVLSVWAKAAGRCCMCGEPQLVSAFGDVTVTIGEVAHQAGAGDGPKSPRGDALVAMSDRDKEENVMLLCHGCHRKIDHAKGQGLYTVEVLREIKAQHEAMVAALTEFQTENRTLVVTTRSTVRGKAAGASPSEIALALVESRRVPYSLGNLTYRVDIDLTDPVSDEWAWKRGMSRVDAAVERISADVSRGTIDHLSVFALAPIPLLVYLGHKLGDKQTVDVFRQSRGHKDRAWCWGEAADDVPAFTFDVSDCAGDEAIAAIEVTAPVKAGRLPREVSALPVIRLHPGPASPGPDLLGSRQALDAFALTWRELLATIERDYPGLKRLHVAAAVPAPAALAIGRFHRSYVDPALVIYEFGEDRRYSPALEIPA